MTLTVQIAATQYSPRLLRSFKSDRTTQRMLGAFIVVAYDTRRERPARRFRVRQRPVSAPQADGWSDPDNYGHDDWENEGGLPDCPEPDDDVAAPGYFPTETGAALLPPPAVGRVPEMRRCEQGQAWGLRRDA